MPIITGGTIVLKRPGFFKVISENDGTPFDPKPAYYIDVDHAFEPGDYGSGLHQAYKKKQWRMDYHRMTGTSQQNGKIYAIWIEISKNKEKK